MNVPKLPVGGQEKHFGMENAPVQRQPYAATPLVVRQDGHYLNSVSRLDSDIELMIGSPNIFPSYGAIGNEIAELGVAESVLNSTQRWIANRLYQQEGLNSSLQSKLPESSPFRDYIKDNYSPDQIASYYQSAKLGIAQPVESHIVHLFQGAESAEYASLTMGPSYNREFESLMWTDIDEIFNCHDMTAEVDPFSHSDGVHRTQILGFDRKIKSSPNGGVANHIGAIRLLTKRKLGTIRLPASYAQGEGSHTAQVDVKCRQYTIIDTRSRSGFSRYLARELINAAAEDEEAIKNADTSLVYRNATSVLNSSQFLDDLRSANLTSSLILARNETVYGVLRQQPRETALRKLGSSIIQQA